MYKKRIKEWKINKNYKREEKDAVGDWLAGVTVTDLLVTSVAPLSSVTVSRTVYVPPAP